MRVAIVSGPRSPQLMGLELAEFRLLEAMRARPGGVAVDVRVVGGRSARRHTHLLKARWIPARPGTLPRRASARADLVHLFGLDLPPPTRKPFVAMIHDLSPLHYDDEESLPAWTDEIVQHASLLLTPSAFTANELCRHFGISADRTRMIGGAPALDTSHALPFSRGELLKLGIEQPFALRYGGYTKRKNVPLLMEAWAQVSVGTLVLAGPPQPARNAILAAAPLLDRVVVLDYVSQRVLTRLLCSAAVLVSTSSYEGFGLPPLEALAAGTPVVAVSKPFVRELCGNAALLVEEDTEALAEALSRTLLDEDLNRELREKGLARAATFSWDRTSAAVCRTYAEVDALM